MASPFDFASLLASLQLNRPTAQPLGLTGEGAPVQLGQVPSFGLQQPGIAAEAPKMPGMPGQGGLMGVQQPSLTGAPQMGQAPQAAAPSMAANVAQPGQVDGFLTPGAANAAQLAGKPIAPKGADMGQVSGLIGQLASAPFALASGIGRDAERPSIANAQLEASEGAIRRQMQAAANANPNMNSALAHRNAANAGAMASLQAAENTLPTRASEMNDQAGRQEERFARGMNVAGQLLNTASTAGAFFSDVRLKENIQPGNAAVQQTLDGIQPHTFDAPALGQQGTTGIMAQQLAQTPAGSQLVQQDPQSGMLAVDGQGATQFALAGLGDLNARIRQLEGAAGGAVQQMAQADQATRPPSPSPTGIPPQQAAPQLEGAAGLTPPPPTAQPSPAPAPAPAPQMAPPSSQVTPAATQSLRDAILERVDQSLRQNLGFDPISRAQGDSPALANNGATAVTPDMVTDARDAAHLRTISGTELPKQQTTLPNGAVIQPIKESTPGGTPAAGTPQDDFVQVRQEMRDMLNNLPAESASARDVSEVLRMMDPVQDPFAMAPEQLARMVRMAQAARDASSRGVPMSQVMQEMGIGNDRAARSPEGSSPKAGGR